mmetsp:Transcript_8800/g.17407  ORF Transcript_8800/g.17407 Transcript_8800/m.17407 type:complete len:293 (-) Transcript_8800:397-1275(-)
MMLAAMLPSTSRRVASLSTALAARSLSAFASTSVGVSPSAISKPAFTSASSLKMRCEDLSEHKSAWQLAWSRGKKKKAAAPSKKHHEEVVHEATEGVEFVHGHPESELASFDIEPYREHMDRILSGFEHELAKLRTGRPDPSMLDHLMVEAYGSQTPLNAVAQGTIRSSKLLVINVFDQSLAPAVCNAIRTANLNLNPSVEGAQINVPLPKITKESREATARIAMDMHEKTKNAVNNVRHNAMKLLTDLKKKKTLSEDEHYDETQMVEELTNEFKTRVHDMAELRKKEIMEN